MIKSEETRLIRHVERMEELRNAYATQFWSATSKEENTIWEQMLEWY
jgi:hypothetical protein